ARALRVTLAANAPDDAGVSELGRVIAARGRALLLFDNFEQVVAHALSTVGPWLAMAPEATFIATSREPLGITGEARYQVGALPEADGLLLFEDRARAVEQRFALDDEDDRASATAIVQRLDGIPLAIELAASRSAVLSPRAILARLDRRLELLQDPRRAG